MSIHTKLIILSLLCAFVQLSCGENQCKKCMVENEVFCVNKTSYHFCMNGIPLTQTLHKCPKDQVCTSSDKICEAQSETITPICDSSCNKCPTDGSKNTCVSKTQFGRCIDNKVAIVSSCEIGSICSTDIFLKAGKICAPPCVVDFFGVLPTCTNENPKTTTISPPTTPNIDSLKAKCNASEQNKKIYYVINDDECKTYVYCEKVGDNVEALLMKCSEGFYDVSLNKCVAQKPEGCGATSPATK